MDSRDELSASPPRQREFETTRWSIVISAGRNSTPDSKRALASLCETYWYPLYAYVRRRVPNVDEAHDMTQAFFTELLERNFLRSAEPQRGRFRAFLLTAFKHFLSKEWSKAKTQKRGGGRAPLSLDFDSADSTLRIEAESGLTAEQLYDQQWAIALLGRIMERLELESQQQAGTGNRFAELKGFIIGDHSGATYADVAKNLGISEGAAKKSASRMRHRFGELLREEIAHTVGRPDEVEDEIRSLFTILEA